MTLDGIGKRTYWPVAPGSYTEDDFWVDPAAGLAIVARGMGAIGGQGKPAGKLAVWSVAGEVSVAASGEVAEAEARLRTGLTRADTAIRRLSQSWPAGLIPPGASLAALLVEGTTAVVAHIGDCRVWRLCPEGIEPLTTDHTLAAEWPAERLTPQLAGVLTRMLGQGHEPALRSVPVQTGDVFLLTTRDVHEPLSSEELARLLRSADLEAADLLSVTDEILRALRVKKPTYGRATLAIVKITGSAAGPMSRGSSEAPRLDWLYRPGAPLRDAPEHWGPETLSRGPDPQWFAEVFGGVMSNDP